MKATPQLTLFWLCFGLFQAGAAAQPATEPVVLETAQLRFSLTPENGAFEIRDKAAAVTWRSSPYHARFGEVSFSAGGKSRSAPLGSCRVERTPTRLTAIFAVDGEHANRVVRVRIESSAAPNVLDISCEADPELQVSSVRLLDDALWVTDREQGYLAVPVREGLLIPANSGSEFTHRFDTYAYEGCHMEMFGVVKNGAAVLVSWNDPYVALDVRSVRTNAVWVSGQQVLSSSLVLKRTAAAVRVQFLGLGDYVTVAKAYREIAKERGWFVPWSEKLKEHPERAKLFGAINYKLWSTLDRQMNEASTREERVRINWTFDEAARVAEHLKYDLQLEKVLFTMGGWIHRGYDNQHPDILPTAPECGGDAAFADCARRVRALGYVLCLHDNYQDIYRDSPSWNEDLVMKNRDGTLTRGGHWAGGLAYLTCSKQALELAKRPQNLPAVKELSHADAYFIDTTYAAGLQECFDPQHPLSRADDLKWKQELSDYARDLYGIFGSECGREWAIPHSDFFEGLTGVSGRSYHDNMLLGKTGGVVVPLFDMVYRECIAMYGKYGYNPSRAAGYVLQHISIGRPLNYHNIPPHLYWKNSRSQAQPDEDSAGVFTRADQGWAEYFDTLDRFVKNTAEILSPLNELTAEVPLTVHQFLTPDHEVQRTVFGDGPAAVEVIVNLGQTPFRHWTRNNGEVILPGLGFLVDSPTFIAFLAQKWGSLRYDSGALFTARSLDDQPIQSSRKLRVFHGFGDSQFSFRGQIRHVQRDAILE